MVESLNNAIVPGGPFFLKTIQVFELAYLSGIRDVPFCLSAEGK